MAYMETTTRRYNEALDHGDVLDRILPATFEYQTPVATFTQREWAIISLVRRDRLSSVYPETKFGRFIRRIFGVDRSNPFSDERLEALRRIAVINWHGGDNVPSSEIAAFLEAGYSERQYELLAGHISVEIAESSGLRR